MYQRNLKEGSGACAPSLNLPLQYFDVVGLEPAWEKPKQASTGREFWLDKFATCNSNKGKIKKLKG